MSEQEQTAQESGDAVGGTALKALAGAAAGGAATYALRKALASRNGHDKDARGEVASKHEAPEGSARDQEDDSEYADEDGLEDSAAEGDEDSEESEDSVERGDEPEGSTEADEDDDDDDSQERTGNGSDRPGAKRSLRGLVTPSRLATTSQLLLPLAEEAASSAGRYVGEHAPETVREQVLPRFIDAFEEAT